MGIKQKIDEHRVYQTNKKIDRNSIIEMHGNIQKINDSLEHQSELILGKSETFVTKDAFFESVDAVGTQITNLERALRELVRERVTEVSTHASDSVDARFGECNSSITKVDGRLAAVEDGFAKISQLLDSLSARIASAYSELEKANGRVTATEAGLARVDSLSENLTKLTQALTIFKDEIEKMKQLEETYKVIANQLIDERIMTEELGKKTADRAAQLILDAFNDGIHEFGGTPQNTVYEAIAEFLAKKNFIQPQSIISSEEIPSDVHIRKLGKDEKFHCSYNILKNYVLSGIVPMVVGPAGSGKSYAIEQLASDLGLGFYMANRIQNTFELTGFVNAAGEYVTTQFYEAFTKGGLFFFDEVDASSPEALVTINAAIAQGYMAFPGHPTNVLKHENFRVVVAANTYGNGATMQYTGRNKLDAATLDRFMVIDWGYDPSLEQKIIEDQELLDACWQIRRAADGHPSVIVSTRGIETLARLIKQEELEQTTDIEVLFRKKFFTTSKKDTIETIIADVTENLSKGNKYYKYIALV